MHVVDESVHDLDAGDKLLVVFSADSFDYIPFRTQAHEGKFFSCIGQRRHDPVTHVAESLEYHPVGYIIVDDGELIAP